MLLDKIVAEVRELSKIINDKEMDMLDTVLFGLDRNIGDVVLSMNLSIRKLVRIEVILENKKFESKVVQKMTDNCLDCINKIYIQCDKLAKTLPVEGNKKDISARDESLVMAYNTFKKWNDICSKAKLASVIISEIIEETWEPLPDDEKEDNVENIVISSETRSVSLNDVASDVGNLNSFFENICRLIRSDQSQSNNIYLRRVETGSLVVAVSCAMQAAPIIAFIFWCVKLYQKAEKRYLDNADNKLKVINDSLSIAKEILKVDPDNKEADEIIQKCGVSVLSFLENNPMGTINGEHYDIGMEKPKIEDKENR